MSKFPEFLNITISRIYEELKNQVLGETLSLFSMSGSLSILIGRVLFVSVNVLFESPKSTTVLRSNSE